MIETAIIERLRADTALVNMLATCNGVPAIFPDIAPENCECPLVVVTVTESNTDTPEMQDVSVNVDFYHHGSSWATARQAAKRIEYDLDRTRLSCAGYGDIRIYKFGTSPIPHEDPREIHYNCQFYARATRDEWIAETRI